MTTIPQQNPDFGVYNSETPVKNPNAVPDNSGAGGSGAGGTCGTWQEPGPNNTNTPPSYSDLFDKHDPAVQGQGKR